MELTTFEVITIDSARIGKIEILSFKEIPEERIKWFGDSDSRKKTIQRGLSLVENALLNPKDLDRFREMTPQEFFYFFREWTEKSGHQNDKKD